MNFRANWLALAAVAVSLTLVAGELCAQQRRQGPPRRDRPPPEMHRRGPGPEAPPLGNLLRRVAKLPTGQQQQALEEDEAFRRLSPSAQQRVRRRLAEFNALPEGRRRALLERFGQGRGRRPRQALFLRVAPLSSKEQERALQADEFFQSMPPSAQQNFRRQLERFRRQPPEERQRQLGRLERFADLTADEQQRLRRRAHRFAEMSPEQRRQAQRVFESWRQLRPPRRELMVRHLRRLQRASPEERRALLKSEEFLSPFSQQERNLLRQVWRLRQVMPPPQVSAEP